MTAAITNIAQTIQTFFTSYPIQQYERKDIIFYPHDDITKVLYIIEGYVSEYDISSSGNEVIVNVFKPGAYFPMSTAINQVPNDYFFEASIPLKVHVAPATDVVKFIKMHPDIVYDLLSRVYKGTDGILRRMAHLMGGNASTRLLFELSNAAQRYGHKDSSLAVTIPITESDLAKRSGLSRETVNRTIQNFKDVGLIKVQSGSLCVTDPQQLERLLGSRL